MDSPPRFLRPPQRAFALELIRGGQSDGSSGGSSGDGLREKLVLVARGWVVAAVLCCYGQFVPITIRERLSCQRSYQINLSQLHLPLFSCGYGLNNADHATCQHSESITTNSKPNSSKTMYSTRHSIPAPRGESARWVW